MSTLVIEHLKASELPAQWVERLNASPDQKVTVHIATEPAAASGEATTTFTTDDPAFGMWRDREDMADVSAYVRRLRASRFTRD